MGSAGASRARTPLSLARRPRSLGVNITLAALTIAAGLASRRYAASLPSFIAQYAGDALWATLVFWLLGICWREASTGRLALGTIAIAVAVEASQLYQARWIDSMRETTIGALILGSGFLWSDLVCYVAGAALAAGVDLTMASASPIRGRN